jgi:hypothetical protein
MTGEQDKSELARRARVAKILSRGDVVLGTDASLARHRLPDSIAEIEAGERVVSRDTTLKQRPLFDTTTTEN